MHFRPICISLVLSFLLLAACAEQELSDQKFETFRIPQEMNDFLVPAKLWDHLMVTDPEAPEPLESRTLTAEEQSLYRKTLILSSVVLELTEKNRGVLLHPRIRIELRNGGGTVDFAKYLGEKTGTFYLKIIVDGFDQAPNQAAMYLSQGKMRRVDGQVIGTGCKSYFRITDSFRKDMAGKGIPLNTTRDLHVSATAGYFFMGWLADGQINVTHVRFIDSRRPDLICPALVGLGT